ncbi:MAG: hypothetical protein AB7E72_16880 [Lysobacterales bacterium]
MLAIARADANPDTTESLSAEKYFGVGQGCNLPVNVSAVGPDGRIYLTGLFTQCGDFKMPAGEGAVYDPRSERFAAIANFDRVDLDGSVDQLAFAGAELYAIGNFSRIGELAASRVARWDGTRWHALGSASTGTYFSGAQSVWVSSIQVSPQGVYVAGQFDEVGGMPANNLAHWNRTTGVWSTLGSGMNAGVNGSVRDIQMGRDGLYVGGQFVAAGGISAPYVARWDGSRWHDLDSGLVPLSTGNPIAALAGDGGEVYVSGNFSVARNPGIRHLARWDGSHWQAVGDPGLAVSPGGALTVSGNSVFVVGVLAGGQMFRFDGTTWTNLGSAGFGGSPASLLVADSTLYAGGSFYSINGQYLDNIARWNGLSWSALALGAPRVSNGVIQQFYRGDSGVYIAGRFSDVDGVAANGIARWNGSRWSPLGDGFDPTKTVFSAITESAGRVYVSYFDFSNGQQVNRVSVWDGSSWSPLGSTFSFNPNSLVAFQGQIYAGGSFSSVGGVPLAALARWNGTGWEAVGGGFAAPAWVTGMAVYQSELYVSHTGGQVGGVSAPAMARWNGTRWASVDAAVANGLVSAGQLVAADSGLLIVGRDASGPGVFRLNDQQWSAIARLPVGEITVDFKSVAVSGDQIFLYGYTFGIRNSLVGRSARFDGQTWGPLYTPGSSAIENAQPLQFVTDDGAVSVLGFDLRMSGQPQLVSEPAGTAFGTNRVQPSRDGTRLVYGTTGDGSTRSQVFLRDRISGTVNRVSDLAQALDPTVALDFFGPAISGDGRTVAFVGGTSQTDGQIFAVRDGVAEIISRSRNGAIGDERGSSEVELNGDGSLAVFSSWSTNLVSGDTNGVSDIYLKHLDTAAVELISAPFDGGQSNAQSEQPTMSDDGQRVAYASNASNLNNDGAISSGWQVLLTDRAPNARRTLVVSRNLSTGEVGNSYSTQPTLTPDGRFGVFTSAASNLVAGDTNGSDDIFFFEYDGTRIVRLERVSVGNYGTQANASSWYPSLSDDGSYVAFESLAGNLVVYDRNARRDVFIKNLSSGEVLRLSATVDGLPPAETSGRPSISGDANSIVFTSNAPNLFANDSNQGFDAFWAPMRKFTSFAPGPGEDQPGVANFVLPTPSPAYPNCPAGYFIAAVDDGPGVGLSPGLFGLELLLDPGGSQRMEGGLNFGGLIDLGQPAFAGFNVQNPANEAQRLDLNLSGYPASSAEGSLPVKIQVIHQPSAGVNELVYERSATLSMAQPLIDSVVIQPGFHVVTVVPEGVGPTAAGGAAEGQIFFQLGTRFVDRVGGGFFGGVVVGGYHATHPFGDASGFAAFCIATAHTATVRTFSEPEYGARGARDLRLRLFDYQRNEILVKP